ncbi:MAG TPA: hypothetical protein VHV55_14565 [Pirellulales bacterium]|nr:hypothetical protein [Pirellulales bacterium]
MRQLVVFLTRLDRWRRAIGAFLAFGVGRRDEPDFAVENANQIGEILGPVGIARGFQQFAVRPHMALDVGARFRQQGLEDRPGRLLMVAVFGRGGGCTECFFKEGDAHALGASDRLERGRRPRPALHHFGEQGQPDADHLAVFRQSSSGLIQKVLVVAASIARLGWQPTVGATKRRQNLARVPQRKQINGLEVLTFDERNIQIPKESGHGHPEIITDHRDALDLASVALPQRFQ